MDGKEVDMSNYEGSVVCLVNVASKWGKTERDYTQFSKICDDYADRGLKVLAFPCNQFGGQEPGTHEEILEFVKKYDNVQDKMTFFEKADVNGAKAREVYSFLKPKLLNDDDTTDVRWNFAKFLVDHEGTPFRRYATGVAPDDMRPDIEALLKKKEESS